MKISELRALAKKRGVDIKGLRKKAEIERALARAESDVVEPVVVEPVVVEPVVVEPVVVEPVVEKPPLRGRPVQVCGFPRSGNHFLAALVAESFFPDFDCGGQITNSGTGHWSQRSARAAFRQGDQDSQAQYLDVPYLKVLGNHRLPHKQKAGKKIYVYRDGRDVALSLYNWAKMRHRAHAKDAVGLFLRRNLDWRCSPGTKGVPRRGHCLFRHWREHLEAWAHTPDVLMVRYEDLLTQKDVELRRIGEFLGIDPVPASLGAVGWNSTGDIRASKWQKGMLPQDKAFFDALIPQRFWGRFEG